MGEGIGPVGFAAVPPPTTTPIKTDKRKEREGGELKSVIGWGRSPLLLYNFLNIHYSNRFLYAHTQTEQSAPRNNNPFSVLKNPN